MRLSVRFVFPFIITVFLLTGCSGRAPVSGQWFENKVSRERVRVEYVGLGKDIALNYTRSIALLNSDMITPPSKPDPGQYSLHYSDADANKRCVGFSQSNARTYYYVMAIADFRDGYTLVKGS